MANEWNAETIAQPTDYQLIWSDQANPSATPASFWRPVSFPLLFFCFMYSVPPISSYYTHQLNTQQKPIRPLHSNLHSIATINSFACNTFAMISSQHNFEQSKI